MTATSVPPQSASGRRRLLVAGAAAAAAVGLLPAVAAATPPSTTAPPTTAPPTTQPPTSGAPASAEGTCGDWSTGDPDQPCGTGQQITFAAGTSSFLFDGGIYDQTQVWYFDASAGQAMEFDLQAADDNIEAAMFSPDGTAMLPDDYVDGDVTAELPAELPADGRYAIVLTATDGGPYGMGLAIDAPEPLPMGDYGRIAFEPGTDSATVSNTVADGVFDTWLFNVDAGQQATLALADEAGTASFTVLDTAGNELAADVTDFAGELATEGFYTVIVAAAGGDADYELSLAIPDGQPQTDTLAKELFFDRGTDQATFGGSLPAAGSTAWVFWADAGQTATFDSLADPVTIEVVSPSGEALATSGDGNDQAVAELADAGLYAVRVWAGPDTGADYSITVTIPAVDGTATTAPASSEPGGDGTEPGGDAGTETLTFPAGTNMSTVEDSLGAAHWRTYLIDAGAGQQLTANVGSGEGTARIELYGPDGAELAGSTNELAVELPTDGEYRLVVGAAEREETYSLYVEIN